jgi:glucose-6-phosphate 1-dehydrogenase
MAVRRRYSRAQGATSAQSDQRTDRSCISEGAECLGGFERRDLRWAGVPFYVRTGKHMAQRTTRFKQAPYSAFQDTPVDSLRPNWLVLGIAPSQGTSLQFEVKRPGSVLDLAAVKMDFRYDDWFAKEPNVGYETLIHDVMIGDQTLFMRADMVEQAWRIVQPVLDAWATEKAGVPNYDSGGDGPA